MGRLGWIVRVAKSVAVASLLLVAVQAKKASAADSPPAMMVPGGFSISETGAFTYKVPIAVPPGTAGMEPSLSLDYSSQAGDGTVGWGWGLSGVPSIGRCPRTLAQDGVHGSVNFNNNDRYCMEGQRLVAVSGSYGANGTIYRTEIDGFSQITSYGTAGNGPSYFVVQTKAGQTMEFGNTTSSRILAQGKTTARTWALDKISDSKGNYLTVTYVNDTTNGQAYPTEIDYTGNTSAGLTPYASVIFVYNTSRLYPIPTYQAGSLSKTTVLLTDVRTYLGTGGTGTLVTDYRLAYTPPASGGAHYELTSVTQCDAATGGHCLAPTSFGWQGSKDTLTLTGTTQAFTGHSGVSAGYYQGSGLTDMIVSSTAVNCGIWFGSPTGFVFSSMNATYDAWEHDPETGEYFDYEYNGPLCKWSGASGFKRATDFNGDGFTDVMINQAIAKGDTQGFPILNSGTALTQVDYPPGYETWFAMSFGDFNGDGRTDFIGDTLSAYIYVLGNGDGTFATGSTITTTSSSLSVGDFDGDGCSDVLMQGATNEVLLSCSPAVASFSVPNFSSSEVVLGDFNGDGLTDILVAPASGAATLYLSTGTGLAAGITFSSFTDWGKYQIYAGDWNGDGKDDILLVAYGQSGYYGVGTSHKIYLSTGTGFVAGPTISNTNSQDTLVTASVADWNNDGAMDFWLVKPSGNVEETFSYVPEQVISVSNGLGISTNVIYKPLNQNGSLYQKCATAGTFVCGTTYPTQSIDGPIYVVSQITSSNGIGGTYSSTYAYRGAQADLHGRGFLGFTQIAATDTQTGVVQTTSYSQVFPLTGIIQSETKVSGSVTLTSIVNTYNAMSLGTGTDGVTHYFIELQKTVVSSSDLNGAAMPAITTTYAYDCDSGSACAGSSPTGFGNSLQIVASVSDGSSRTTSNAYVNDTSNGHWYLARLTSATQNNVVGSSNLTRQTSYTYDTGLSTSTGLLQSEIVEPESSSDPTLKLETDYSYDAFGNKTQATVKGCVWSGSTCSTTARLTQTAFDATTYHGQFPTTVTNALTQQETWSYTGDTQFGGPAGHTGPNGLTTSWQYDTFGRKTLETRPDGNKTAFAYNYCTTTSCPSLPPGLTLAQLPANVQFYVISTPESSSGTQNGPVTAAFYDGLSRQIAGDIEGFDATGTGCTTTAPCWIRSAKQYDAWGRIAQTSRPYFVTGGTPQWTVDTYDVLGRITLATFADSSTLATSYCGLTVSTTNADNQIRTTVDNAQGKVAQVYELATAICNTSGNLTRYVYDAFDNQLTVTDPANNTVANNTYDIRGRKTKSIDPDKGTWAYVYDGYGELATQTDAKNQTTTITYDTLGRILTHNAAGFTSTYVYDTASGKGVDLLASATTGSSYTRTFAYDSFGRPSTVTLTEDGAAHAYAFSYDANGRLLTLGYPSGFTAKYTYTANGNLYQISDNGAGTVFWTANTRDAEMHLLSETQGNGVTTTQAFNPATALIQSIVAGPGNSVSNQSFTFDPLGNLMTRTWLNGSSSVKENACYDGLNRVTSALITTGTGCTGTGAVTIAYDALGNITEKSDICATASCFVFGGTGAGPHALTSIVGTYNGVTNPTFTYDANGLMTAGAGRTVTATTFDMAGVITDGANSATFSYDSEHARYKMVSAGINAGTTYYLNDPSTGALEEESIVSGATTWHDYMLAAGKLVAERFCTGAAPCTASPTLTYFVLDHLGSVAVIVSSSGSILNQLSYDAWGKRRNADGSTINCTAGTSPPSGVTRGFIGQEMIDGLCLVNLNARVYDPSIGRFMAADPTVGDETIPQELNRYTYALDNPLSLTDPSGLCFLGCFWRSALFRDLLGIAVAIILEQPEILGPLDDALGLSSIATGDLAVINGGIIGGISGVVSTGSLKGAALGALQGGLFAEAGNILKAHPNVFGIGHAPSEFIAHGLVGGIVSVAGGGKFQSGFLAGGFSSFTPAPTQGQSLDATLKGTLESAVLGGAGSVLGGGKFANGAVTGAFAYLMNACAHAGCFPSRQVQLWTVYSPVGLGAYHTFDVLEQGDNLYFFRAGPGPATTLTDLDKFFGTAEDYFGLGSTGIEPFGDIYAQTGAAAQKTENGGSHAVLWVFIGYVNMNWSDAVHAVDVFAAGLNNWHILYSPINANSNSAAFQLPTIFGIERPTPAAGKTVPASQTILGPR